LVTREVGGRTTLSFAKNGDFGIRDTLLGAINRAKQYIFIEDQYFTNRIVSDRIIERLQQGLEFLIIILPEKTWGWDVEVPNPLVRDDDPVDLVAQIVADPNHRKNVRICSLTHPAGERIYVHSKTLIIDDIFVSCGSANMDVLGLSRDPDQPVSQECNCMVIDEAISIGGVRIFARNLRLDLWAEHLQVQREDLEALTPVEAFHKFWAPIQRTSGHVNILWRP
jgi:phosphatidylserine/phosphatidylglycerophosphate/cardiolipin synthase-like enzyme